MISSVAIMLISLFIIICTGAYNKIVFMLTMMLSPVVLFLASSKLNSNILYFMFFIYFIGSAYVVVFMALFPGKKGRAP